MAPNVDDLLPGRNIRSQSSGESNDRRRLRLGAWLGLMGLAAVVIVLGWLGVIGWLDDHVDLPALPVPDFVQRLLDDDDYVPTTTATRTVQSTATPSAREPEVVTTGTRAYTSSAECLAYLAIVESNPTSADLLQIAADQREMERQRRSGLYIPDYEPCSSFGERDVDPVNKAHATWSRKIIQCEGDSYWPCIRLSTENFIDVLVSQRPLWPRPLAKAQLRLYEAAYRLKQFGAVTNPNSPILVADVNKAWQEWLAEWQPSPPAPNSPTAVTAE
jgi:hypothetical protein